MRDAGPGAVAVGADGKLWITRNGSPTLLPPLPSRIARLTFEEPPAAPAVAVVAPPMPPAPKRVTARGSIRLTAVRGGYRVRYLRLSGSRPCLDQRPLPIGVRSAQDDPSGPRDPVDLTPLFAPALIGSRAVLVIRVTRVGRIGRELRWTLRNGRATLHACTLASSSLRAVCARP